MIRLFIFCDRQIRSSSKIVVAPVVVLGFASSMKKSPPRRTRLITSLSRHLVVGLLLSSTFFVGSTIGSQSVSAAPVGASSFRGVSPTRVLDTRLSVKAATGSYNPVLISGLAGVPNTATAVVLNVTVVNPEGEGYVTVFPWGDPSLPNTSNVNIQRSGQMVANLVTVRLGGDGRIGLYTSIAADLLVDVFGYYSPSGATRAGRFIPFTPQRLLDTRGNATVGEGRTVRLSLPAGIPVDTEGLVLNVTAVNSRLRANGFGYWSAYPAGQDPGTTSNINISFSGQTIANQVIVKPSATGVEFYSYAGGDLLVDIMGYYTGAGSDVAVSEYGLFVPVSPTRLLDTRSTPNPLGEKVALHHNWTVEVGTASQTGIPSTGASAVALNVTMTRALGEGFVTAYPAGLARPDSSNLNANRAGVTAPNHAQLATGTRGVSFYSYGGADLIVDIFGWFVGEPKRSTLNAPTNSLPEPEGFPGNISIPQIGLKSLVREGTEFVNFDPSHLVESRTPNQPGNVAIFGHRVSHGHEFKNVDKLGVNSLVYLTIGTKLYTYRVTGVDIRLPSDPMLYASTSNDQTLSLVACHPPHSVKYRIVVHAVLIDIAEY
jgi:LPXTG-site transpeptidase (sortase) family protein